MTQLTVASAAINNGQFNSSGLMGVTSNQAAIPHTRNFTNPFSLGEALVSALGDPHQVPKQGLIDRAIEYGIQSSLQLFNAVFPTMPSANAEMIVTSLSINRALANGTFIETMKGLDEETMVQELLDNFEAVSKTCLKTNQIKVLEWICEQLKTQLKKAEDLFKVGSMPDQNHCRRVVNAYFYVGTIYNLAQKTEASTHEFVFDEVNLSPHECGKALLDFLEIRANNLTTLSLENCALSPNTINGLIDWLQESGENITELNLSGNQTTDDLLKQILHALSNTQIRELTLQACSESDNGIIFLLDEIARDIPWIKSLKITLSKYPLNKSFKNNKGELTIILHPIRCGMFQTADVLIRHF